MNMLELRFKLINLFAEHPLTGSAVAVFTDATGLSSEAMQAVAMELNRARTIFVFPPEQAERTPRIAVYSPRQELGGREGSSIGVAFALGLDTDTSPKPSRVVLESRDGPISVSTFARVMTVAQPIPFLTGAVIDEDAVIATLGLGPEEQLRGAPIVASHGSLSYLLVPLRSRRALAGIRFRHDIWERTVRYAAAPRIVAFTLETDRPGSIASIRVFAPGDGNMEEWATEEACGPVVAYLVDAGLVARASPQLVVLEQGADVGRPSFLHVAFERDETTVKSVRVGGPCCLSGEGTLWVPTDLKLQHPIPVERRISDSRPPDGRTEERRSVPPRASEPPTAGERRNTSRPPASGPISPRSTGGDRLSWPGSVIITRQGPR